jgi:hypothetical protein
MPCNNLYIYTGYIYNNKHYEVTNQIVITTVVTCTYILHGLALVQIKNTYIAFIAINSIAERCSLEKCKDTKEVIKIRTSK